jgi:hypothetical protein
MASVDPLSTRSRWIAVGRSDSPDPTTAARDAIAGALTGPDPKLLIVFCSSSYDRDALARALDEAASGVPLVGCSTAGEIATSGPGECGVVVTALGGPGFSVATAVARDAAPDLRAAGAHVATCMRAIDERPHRALLLLTDGLAGDQTLIVRGAYSVVGAQVPLVGGCAGDDLKMTCTHQFHGGEALTGAVVGVALGSDAPLGIGVRHGWRRVGEPMLITRSAANRVHEIDSRPALDVYFERLGAPADVRHDQEAFVHFAQTHPLGLASRSEEHVRFIGDADFEDRSLGCIAEVPQGALAWLMEGDDSSVLDATDAACADALAALDGNPPLGLLAFDCIARRGVLGDEGIRREVERVAHCGAGAPVAGFYTYGEIARTRGINGFHNQTLVVLAVG